MTPTQTDPLNNVVRTYKEIKKDYAFDPSIFSEEDDRARRVKWIIDNRLSQVDKTLILLYADCASFRKLGARLFLSHMTVRKEIQRIKCVIMDEYQRLDEVWADVPGYEGLYKVSNLGAVRSFYTLRPVSQDTSRKTPTVRLYKSGTVRRFRVPDLVFNAFKKTQP